jgi:hypothetical protein
LLRSTVVCRNDRRWLSRAYVRVARAKVVPQQRTFEPRSTTVSNSHLFREPDLPPIGDDVGAPVGVKFLAGRRLPKWG